MLFAQSNMTIPEKHPGNKLESNPGHECWSVTLQGSIWCMDERPAGCADIFGLRWRIPHLKGQFATRRAEFPAPKQPIKPGNHLINMRMSR